MVSVRAWPRGRASRQRRAQVGAQEALSRRSGGGSGLVHPWWL
jgi:hypothetical protein